MGKAPAFQTYASDYFMDTNSWTVDEIGIYQRLLLTEWVNGGLPNDKKRLARIAGCSVNKFQKGWEQIQIKFILNNAGFFVNKRLEQAREDQANYLKLQSDKGKKSAKKRWGTKITTVTKRLQPTHQPNCNSSSSSSSSSSIKDKDIYMDCVFLTKNEHLKLIEKEGDIVITKAIEVLNNYKMSSGKKYKSDYHALLTWGIDRAKNSFNQTKGEKNYESPGKHESEQLLTEANRRFREEIAKRSAISKDGADP